MNPHFIPKEFKLFSKDSISFIIDNNKEQRSKLGRGSEPQK